MTLIRCWERVIVPAESNSHIQMVDRQCHESLLHGCCSPRPLKDERSRCWRQVRHAHSSVIGWSTCLSKCSVPDPVWKELHPAGAPHTSRCCSGTYSIMSGFRVLAVCSITDVRSQRPVALLSPCQAGFVPPDQSCAGWWYGDSDLLSNVPNTQPCRYSH